MANYQYIAKTAAGEQVAGVIDADNEAAAIRSLDEKRLFPVRVSEQAEARQAMRRGGRRVRMRDLSAAKAQVGRSGKFVGYQAVQLHGGMGVSQALDIGHHYIRLTVINQLFGDQSFHLQRFADLSEHIDMNGPKAA